MTNPALLLARKALANWYRARPTPHPATVEEIEDGKCDDYPGVQSALAAIRETTERAAKLVEVRIIDARMGDIDNDLRSISHIITSDIRANLHLEKGSTDEWTS